MFYIIDYDTGIVESKSKTELPLVKYIAENKLELAVALVSSDDELTLKLSLREIKRVWRNFDNTKYKKIKNEIKNNLIDLDHHESVLAMHLFSNLENNQRKIPTFNKRLGKKLIKEAKKRCPDVRTKKKTNELSQKKKAIQKRAQRTTGKETSELKSIFGKI